MEFFFGGVPPANPNSGNSGKTPGSDFGENLGFSRCPRDGEGEDWGGPGGEKGGNGNFWALGRRNLRRPHPGQGRCGGKWGGGLAIPIFPIFSPGSDCLCP